MFFCVFMLLNIYFSISLLKDQHFIILFVKEKKEGGGGVLRSRLIPLLKIKG
jgi:hypothetical protein